MELKSCPFCGYTEPYIDEYQHAAGECFRVICPRCMAMVDNGTCQSRSSAAEAWNMRVQENERG